MRGPNKVIQIALKEYVNEWPRRHKYFFRVANNTVTRLCFGTLPQVKRLSIIKAIRGLRGSCRIEDGLFLIVLLIWITASYKIMSILGYSPHGDAPYFMAWIINFRNGNFADPVNYGELVYYPPMLAILGTVAYAIFKPNLSEMFGFYAPYFNVPAILVFYFINRRLFGPRAALFSTYFLLFVMPATSFHLIRLHSIVLQYSFTFLLIYFMHKRRYIASGIVLGLVALTSIITTLVAGFSVLCYLVIRREFKYAVVTPSVGAAISSPFWAPLAIRYGFHITSEVSFGSAVEALSADFWGIGLLTFLLAVGGLLDILRRNGHAIPFAASFLGVATAGKAFQQITYRIYKVYFNPHEFVHLAQLPLTIFAGYALDSICCKISKKSVLTLICLALLVVYPETSAISWYNTETARVLQGADIPSEAKFLSYPTGSTKQLINWVNSNTEINDVVLAHESVGYWWISGWTGRKVLAYRADHPNYFLSPNQVKRNQAAAYIFHHLNSDKVDDETISLLKFYRIKYVIVSSWEKAEYGADPVEMEKLPILSLRAEFHETDDIYMFQIMGL